MNDDKVITDSFENTVTKENLISLKDAEALKEAVSFSLEKTPKAAKKPALIPYLKHWTI